MTTTVIIPARLQSGRVQEKLIQNVGGVPIIQHTWEQAMEAGVGPVYIATDSTKMGKICNDFGAFVVFTDERPNGTSRCQYVAMDHGIKGPIINVQGDSPQMPVDNIRQLAKILGTCPPSLRFNCLFTLYEENPSLYELSDVKVLLNSSEEAMWFTRQPVPGAKKHCGIYGYYGAMLDRYVGLSDTYEKLEGLEQMRFIEHGLTVFCPKALKPCGISINTPADLEAFRNEYK